MNKKLKTIGVIFAVIGLVVVGYFISLQIPSTQGAAPGGMQTAWATSSRIVLSLTEDRNLFATSTSNCISRTVTTLGDAITIKIGDHAGFTLTSSQGHLQIASTTVSYDSAVYGCGLWTARSATASATPQAIVTEFNGFR